MKTGENGHFEFLGQKVKILAFSHKKLFKNVILIIGNYTNDIRSKNFKKSNISEKKNMVANFGFKITFLNSFLCEKIRVKTEKIWSLVATCSEGPLRSI